MGRSEDLPIFLSEVCVMEKGEYDGVRGAASQRKTVRECADFQGGGDFVGADGAQFTGDGALQSADTYFVGMLNDPVQTAAVTLASPVLLAFNAINNLFGVGSSSMMSRAMGRRDMQTVRRSSALGF